MGIGLKLVNKLKRRKKSLNKNKGFRTQDKIDRLDEVLASSPAAYELVRKVSRRFDRNFGQQQLPDPQKEQTEKLRQADLTGVANTSLTAVLGAGIVRDAGLKAGDYVEVLTGSLKGQQLYVLTVDYSTDTITLTPTALNSTETAVQLKLHVSSVIKSYF